MRAIYYVVIIWLVVTVLFSTVDELEPNRRLASLLKLLVAQRQS
jgi:hypothetical protein